MTNVPARTLRSILLAIAFLAAACSSSSGGTLTITSPSDGSTASTATITVTGTAPANTEVVRDISLAPDTRTTAGSNGNWAMSVDLEQGANTLTFRIGDDASSARSITVSYLGGAKTPAPTTQPQTSQAPDSLPAATFKDITLTGKGDKVAKFKIPQDATAIAVLTHNGSSNFAVESIDSSGATLGLLVNTIGKYSGTVLFDVNAGEHSVAFKITADGPWSATIKPVTEAKAWNPSTTLKGTGDNVYRLSPASSGLVTLDLTFRGDGNFAVRSYSQDGADLLANEIDNFSGQVLLPDDTFLFEVLANGGTWTAKPG
jgi:hypothetical protein